MSRNRVAAVADCPGLRLPPALISRLAVWKAGLSPAFSHLEVACSAESKGKGETKYGAACRPFQPERSINFEHLRMSEEETVDLAKLLRDERQKWQDNQVLSPGALRDFQQLSEEEFHSLRDKYYRPADLVAEMGLRARLRVGEPRKSIMRTAIDAILHQGVRVSMKSPAQWRGLNWRAWLRIARIRLRNRTISRDSTPSAEQNPQSASDRRD